MNTLWGQLIMIVWNIFHTVKPTFRQTYRFCTQEYHNRREKTDRNTE